MKFQKFTALLLAVLLVLSLAACGTKDNEKKADMSSNDSAMTDEPKNAEEALALHKKLMEQENTILSQNTALWEKVFMEADKGMAMVEDGKTMASSCWIPSRAPKTSSPTKSMRC